MNQPATETKPGPFITFEGLDGSGKSTQLRLLAARLREQGHRVLETREPGGTPLGEEIRRLALEVREEAPAPRAELGLMFAARADQCARRIEPARAQGIWVLCDRFTDASEAYQGAGRGLGGELVRQLHAVLCPESWPDLTFFLEVEIATCLERSRQRLRREASREARFEGETEEFFRKVRDGYREIQKREPDRFRVIAAEGEIYEVAGKIWQEVEAWKNKNRAPNS